MRGLTHGSRPADLHEAVNGIADLKVNARTVSTARLLNSCDIIRPAITVGSQLCRAVHLRSASRPRWAAPLVMAIASGTTV